MDGASASSPIPDESHLGLEPHATALPHLVLPETHQGMDIGCRRTTQVHDEVGVVARHLGPADRLPLEPRQFDEPTGELACGVLEDGSGVRKAYGLLAPALRLNRLDNPPQLPRRRAQQAEPHRGYHDLNIER